MFISFFFLNSSTGILSFLGRIENLLDFIISLQKYDGRNTFPRYKDEDINDRISIYMTRAKYENVQTIDKNVTDIIHILLWIVL